MKQALKTVLHAVFLLLALPLAIVAGFGRIGATFAMGAHAQPWLESLPGYEGFVVAADGWGASSTGRRGG